MRKTFLTLAISGLLTATAAAGTGKTLVEKGATVTAGEMSYGIAFAADGSYSATTGETGTYTLEGDTMCLTPSSGEGERCVELPAGKGSGDSFEVAGPGGRAATMTIN